MGAPPCSPTPEKAETTPHQPPANSEKEANPKSPREKGPPTQQESPIPLPLKAGGTTSKFQMVEIPPQMGARTSRTGLGDSPAQGANAAPNELESAEVTSTDNDETKVTSASKVTDPPEAARTATSKAIVTTPMPRRASPPRQAPPLRASGEADTGSGPPPTPQTPNPAEAGAVTERPTPGSATVTPLAAHAPCSNFSNPNALDVPATTEEPHVAPPPHRTTQAPGVQDPCPDSPDFLFLDWGQHLLVISLNRVAHNDSLEDAISKVETWIPTSDSAWVQLITCHGPGRINSIDLRTVVFKWEKCQHVKATWFHEEDVVAQLITTLARSPTFSLPTSAEDAVATGSILIEQRCTKATSWLDTDNLPIENVTYYLEGMISMYNVQRGTMLMQTAMIPKFGPGKGPEVKSANQQGWSLVRPQPGYLPVGFFQTIGGAPLIRHLGTLTKVLDYKEALDLGYSLPTHKMKALKKGKLYEPFRPVLAYWSQLTEPKWEFKMVTDMVQKMHPLTKCIAAACVKRKLVRRNPGPKRTKDKNGTDQPPPGESAPGPPLANDPDTEHRRTVGPSTQRPGTSTPTTTLTPIRMNVMWGNRNNAALTHLVRLLAGLNPGPPQNDRKENPIPDPDESVLSVEAVFTRFTEGASIHMSSWSPLGTVTMAETVEALRKSKWLSDSLGPFRHLELQHRSDGTQAISPNDMGSVTHGGLARALLFVSIDGKVSIPWNIWSWFWHSFILVAILDDRGTGAGLHRTLGGPCWVTPWQAQMHWPSSDDKTHWDNPILVWAENTEARPCNCEGENLDPQACGKCGTEVLCGTKHATPPFTSLCQVCADLLSTRCFICKKKVRNTTIMRCGKCLMRAHPQCTKGLWTTKGCPSPACHPPPMHPDAASSCCSCRTPTVHDVGAWQCAGCKRDLCSAHTLTPARHCKKCSEHLKKTPVTKTCAVTGHRLRWWSQAPTPPSPEPARNKYTSPGAGSRP